MAVHLIGETLDKTRSHYMAETGKLVRLMRGIYVDANDDVDATITRHTVRIAKYLYPQAYLSAASATSLGPTRDGRLFLSARRKQRTRIRALEIIQNEAPKHPSIGEAIVDDGMGEFRISVSSIRQRFLEAFRLRSEHASSIDEEMRTTIAIRLIEEYGSAQAAADALWTLARENEWYREGELAERYLRHRPSATPAKNEAALDLTVAWHSVPLGHLTHDGFEWRWKPTDLEGPSLIGRTTLANCLPLSSRCCPRAGSKKCSTIKTSARCCGRASATCRTSLLRSAKRNWRLTGEHSDDPSQVVYRDGGFTGQYAGRATEFKANFEHNLHRSTRLPTPRLAGVQIKAPMFSDAKGICLPASASPSPIS